MLKVAKPKSPSLDELDFIVNTFDDATSRTVAKVIGNLVRPVC